MAFRSSRLQAVLKQGLPFLGLVLLVIGVQFVEYPYERIAGNVCDGPEGLCYEPGWKVGIPLAWARGSKVSAYAGSWHEEILIMNIVMCSLILFTGYLLWGRIRMSKQDTKELGL